MKTILIFGSNGMLGNYLTSYFNMYNDKYIVKSFNRKDYDILRDSADYLKSLIQENTGTENDTENDVYIINAIGIIPQTRNVNSD